MGCHNSSVDSSTLSIKQLGFESQTHHLRFYHILQWNLCYICLCIVKRTKINKKRPDLAHLLEHFACFFIIFRNGLSAKFVEPFVRLMSETFAPVICTHPSHEHWIKIGKKAKHGDLLLNIEQRRKFDTLICT